MQALSCLLVFAVCFTSSTAWPRKGSGVVGGEEMAAVRQIGQHPQPATPPQPSRPSRSTDLRDVRRSAPRLDSSRLLPAATARRTTMGSRRLKRSLGTLEYNNVVYHGEFRVQGDEPLFLTPTPSGSQPALALATHPPASTTACLRLHFFDVLSLNTNVSQVVVLETNNGGHHLHGNATGHLSLTVAGAGWVHNVTANDHRLFFLYSPIGDTHYRIKHVFTDRYLQARPDGVSLVPGNPRAAPGMHFQLDPCTRAVAT